MLIGFTKTSQESQQLAAEISVEYLSGLDKFAADPTYVGTCGGHTLSNMEAQFLTMVTEGVSLSFLCRMPGCLFYGDNAMWVQRAGGKHQFKCPCCGEMFRPWADYKGSVVCQFVVQFFTDTGRKVAIPATWPDNEDVSYFYKLMELHSRQVKTEADVQAWRNRTKIELSELLTRVSCEEQFDRFPFCSDHARFSSVWEWEALAAKG